MIAAPAHPTLCPVRAGLPALLPWLRHVAYRRGVRGPNLNDFVNDAAVQMLEGASGYVDSGEPGALRRWASVVVRNLVIKQWRARTTLTRRAWLVPLERTGGKLGEVYQIEPPVPPTQDAAVMLGEVARLAGRLVPRHQALLVQAAYGFATADNAERAQLSLARKQLKSLMENKNMRDGRFSREIFVDRSDADKHLALLHRWVRRPTVPDAVKDAVDRLTATVEDLIVIENTTVGVPGGRKLAIVMLPTERVLWLIKVMQTEDYAAILALAEKRAA